MAALQTVLNDLNTAFSKDNVHRLARRKDAFAPGQPLGAGLVVQKGTPLYEVWQAYLAEMPGGVQETLRAIIYYALSTDPPTFVTFAWAPGYDYEVTMWHAPDTRSTKGGITVLIKSRYPDDAHPVKRARQARARRK